MTNPSVHRLTIDRRRSPLGIGGRPEFGWELQADEGQTAFVIELWGEPAAGPRWTSGWVESERPFGVVYDGPALASNAGYRWRVRVRLGDGATTAWSEPAAFETGLLDAVEWAATWITAPSTTKKDRRTLYFVRDIDLPSVPVRARAFVSALGWYRLRVNSSDVTGHALVPRWTPFDTLVEYQSYDVTTDLVQGRNRVGITVADGRYRGHMGFTSKGARYGDRLAVLARIVIELADGTSITVVSASEWRVGAGRIRSSDPKFGERVDLRISDSDWMEDGALEGEQPATPLPPHPRALIEEQVPRVGAIGSRRGSVTRTPSGVQLVDFGQNFAGVARVRLSGPEGTTARLLYGEVLTTAGELDTGYLGPHPGRQTADWFQRDEVVLTAEPVDYTPSFTIHGFRYLAIEHADPVGDDDVEGVVLSSDLPQISSFRCSDPRLEQLWHNVVWSLRSNFTDTPTDCPTRERSGWTGDAQIFGPTAAQLVDTDTFFRRYLRNAALEQRPDGTVPPYIPAEHSAGRGWDPLTLTSTSVGWGDVLVMLPWTLYEYYGDEQVLRTQYDAAKRWVDQLEHRAASRRGLARTGRRIGPLERYIVDTGRHWGEWLRPDDTGLEALKNLVLRAPAAIATAYLANSARLLASMADVLARTDDTARYGTLADHAAEAWRTAFVRDGGSRIADDKQDDYVRALAFDLVPKTQRAAAAARLVELIDSADGRIGTGFLSTPMLLAVLVDAGHVETAYRLLLRTGSPSWLGQIERGATSVWETWDGLDKHGNASGSYNHYAFGAVARFLQERVAGLSPAGPGYRRIRIAPVIGGGLTSAAVEIRTPYGTASTAWRRTGSGIEVDALLPPGVQGTLHIGGETRELRAGTQSHSFDA